MIGGNEVGSSSSSSPSSISSTLLEQVRARRPEAWDRFVRLYSPLVYRWCRRSGLSAADSADVLQEVLCAVMLHIHDFRHDRPQDTFSGWLATITRNKVHDHFRRLAGEAKARGGSTAQRQIAEIPGLAEPSTENIQSDGDSKPWLSRQVLELVRAEFETGTWEAFWRVSVDGQTPANVAEDLQMSVAAIYKAKSRILERFRQVLAELPE
jgi:RNA polymerase sigma-70 factor, ECF subfamily